MNKEPSHLDLRDFAYEGVNEILKNDGFYTKSLAEHNLPETKLAANNNGEAVPYAIFGDIAAKNVLLHTTPYLTKLDPHFKIRLKAQQAVLREDYCVVGVEAYTPGVLNHQERRKVTAGDFGPLAVRALLVSEQLKLNDDQNLHPYGYSMGGDMAVQIAHDVLLDPNRGIAQVNKVGAAEPARVLNRGAFAVMRAQMSSGKGFYDNVVASEMPALNEALGIKDGVTKKKFDKAVGAGVGRYMGADPLDNRAIIRGFGKDTSVRQLEKILENPEVTVMLGRQEESTVTPEAAIAGLRGDKLYVVTAPGDHSRDDHIQTSAVRAMYFGALKI